MGYDRLKPHFHYEFSGHSPTFLEEVAALARKDKGLPPDAFISPSRWKIACHKHYVLTERAQDHSGIVNTLQASGLTSVRSIAEALERSRDQRASGRHTASHGGLTAAQEAISKGYDDCRAHSDRTTLMISIAMWVTDGSRIFMTP